MKQLIDTRYDTLKSVAANCVHASVSNLLQDFGVSGVAPFTILMHRQRQLWPCHASEEVHKRDTEDSCQKILRPSASGQVKNPLQFCI